MALLAGALTSSVPGRAAIESDFSIVVTNVDELYGAVNDPANAGATVVLAPGRYVLSADRPNGGRLELQTDMSLIGVEGDRAAVTIDASDPRLSFSVSFGRTGAVRIGRGSNTIEWLTVLGNPAAAAGIATELTGTPTTRIRVAHVVSGGSSRGIDVRNAGATMVGRRIDAEIVDNEFFGPEQPLPGTMSEGIRLANFVGADNGVIVATLSGNRAHGFQLGCIVANNRSSHAAVYVRSSGDRFFANARGCLIAGGLNQSPTGVANSNSTVFEAFGSQFIDNTAQIGGIDPGGIRIAGGLSTTLTNATSDNTVSVSLTGSKVSGNQVVDFEAFGAIQTALSGIAGTNNHVTIALRGVSRQIDVVAVDSEPEDPNGTNTVTVVRIPSAKKPHH
jgi:hypothetical protein